MSSTVLPQAKALYLCDYQTTLYATANKTDLYGVFHDIRPAVYPHVHKQFCVFAQLVGGVGDIQVFVDIRRDPLGANQLVRTTETKTVRFLSPDKIVQFALAIEGCRFDEKGLYVVELFCENESVADVSLWLL
jgi:hypothetical protein